MNQSNHLFESITLTPAEVLAGDTVEFVVRWVIGSEYPDQPTRMVLSCPGMLGQSRINVHDWEEAGFGRLYVSNPDVDSLARVWNSEICELPSQPPSDRFKKKGTWGQRFAVIDLGAGLRPGDLVEWHWGDVKRGYSIGCHVTMVSPKPGFQNTIDISFYTDQERGIPDLDRDYKDNPRPQADARFALPITVRPRETERVRVRRTARGTLALPLDRFWNVAEPDIAESLQTDAPPTRKLVKASILGKPDAKVTATMDDKTLTVAVPEASRDPIDTIVVLELDGDAVAIEPINLWQGETE